jgi:Protein of unknown function (DUF3179)
MSRAWLERRLPARPSRVILAAVGAFAVVVATAYALEALDLWSARNGVSYGTPRPQPSGSWFRPEADGVRTPPAVAAEAAGLDDAEEVVGVVVNGVARAYRLGAFRDPQHHVVNDLVGGTPVSVAYCDLTDCIRTYTGPGAEPLRVRIAGIKDGSLVVKLDGVYYDHQTGGVVEGPPGAAPLPHDQVPWTRTTWGGWRREHPATEVCVGLAAAPNPVESRPPAH